MSASKITADAIRSMKGGVRKIASLTAYDFAMARLLDAAGIPLLLVGDSLGMVVLGYPDTTHVTMTEMEHHVRAVARARPAGLVAADLPFQSYLDPSLAVTNARRLIAAGAEAVKAEGGRSILPQARAIVAEGIPFFAHLGMLPQSIQKEGGYRVKGKTELEHQALIDDAAALAEAGAFAIVLELVSPLVAAELTRAVPIPTIGIASGNDCDGQILVTTDLLGTTAGFVPKHVKPPIDHRSSMRRVVEGWRASVEKGVKPW